MNCLSSDNLENIKTFIAATQKDIQDDIQVYEAKSVQIDQQEFWRIVNSCGKTNQEIKDSIPKEKNDETLRSCYSQIFDFFKIRLQEQARFEQ
ncbi:hypothetical protein [Parasitella parasitica]|uniref:Uncharacterized protein n=1 Tax=Parasitella parasitica TaxID=35722 RepID=A0A0B7MMN7_9FUNG|nr:hypothetical protein [Parasitella parasitica]